MAKATLKDMRRIAKEVLDEQINEIEQKILRGEEPESPAKVNDGFHDIQLGAEEIKILLEMFKNGIPHDVRTYSPAFNEVTEIIVKDAFNWLNQGLENIARGYSDLDYETTDGQGSCQVK